MQHSYLLFSDFGAHSEYVPDNSDIQFQLFNATCFSLIIIKIVWNRYSRWLCNTKNNDWAKLATALVIVQALVDSVCTQITELHLQKKIFNKGKTIKNVLKLLLHNSDTAILQVKLPLQLGLQQLTKFIQKP